MIIPRTFRLFNQTIKVQYSRTLLSKHKAYGMWYGSKNTIVLQQSTKEHKLTKEQIDQTFIHEVTHACLELMGEHDLSANEKFVCAFSNLLHQFIEETN